MTNSSLPNAWSVEELIKSKIISQNSRFWVTKSIRKLASHKFGLPEDQFETQDLNGASSLIVIGGGNLIDQAKYSARTSGRNLLLVAIPSLWGSGAECTPIVVLGEDGKKKILVDNKFIPDHRVIWQELSKSIPLSLAKYGCGDAWAHALEGFLSPIATEALRAMASTLIKEMLKLPLGNDPRWFELSGKAAHAQSNSGVGLIHGIAHTLEHPLNVSLPESSWGHAKLCASYIYPVMRFNLEGSSKMKELFLQYGLLENEILAHLKGFFDRVLYEETLPFLEKNWNEILRDRLTRINSVLVKKNHLDFFLSL